jgi:predicted enzyme related to lactoylglutathione lyase
METMTNAIGWVEIPVADFARAKKFYGEIFAYDMPEMPMGSGTMGMLPYDQEKGGIGGAIVAADGYMPSTHGTLVYLNGGANLETVLNRVEAAGGHKELDKTQIPGMGYYAYFIDTEGNKVGLYSMG